MHQKQQQMKDSEVSSKATYHMVLCTDSHGCIGIKDKLLFRAPIDMQRFKTLTSSATPNKHVVLMGRTTWSSLPDSSRPLPNRINVVLTRDAEQASAIRKTGAWPFLCMDSALQFLDSLASVDRVFVIGGASLYNSPKLLSRTNTIHHTLVQDDAFSRYNGTPEREQLVCVDLDRMTCGGGGGSPGFECIESWTAAVPCAYADEIAPSSAALDTTTTSMSLSFRTWKRKTATRLPAPVVGTVDPYISITHAAPTLSGERQYLLLLQKLLGAPRRQTRNSITLSSFGERMVIDLSDGTVPLLTSKKMAWKTVIRELLWFVRGDTSNVRLREENVHIWDANGSREFLDSRGLTNRAVDDLGPVYGFQWRHFGAQYETCDSEYTGKGVDQLECSRKQIMEDPHSRRMIFSAWNPVNLDEMALPPCHLLGQWYLTNDDRLWLQVYQRSGDVFLGVPFNLFSYSVMIHMMAHLTKKKVGGLVHVLGDAHIYEGHLDVVREQLTRTVHTPPRFRIKDTCLAQSWEEFTLDSFELEDYVCEGGLKAKMVA